MPSYRPRVDRPYRRRRQSRAGLWISAAAILAMFIVYLNWEPRQRPGDAGNTERPAEAEQIAQARKIVERYLALARAFDTGVADLIADEATLIRTRRTHSGVTHKEAVSGAEYKRTIMLSMPLAQAKDQRSDYSDFTYKVVPRGVQVDCMRRTAAQRDPSPHQLLVGPSAAGEWKILHEEFWSSH